MAITSDQEFHVSNEFVRCNQVEDEKHFFLFVEPITKTRNGTWNGTKKKKKKKKKNRMEYGTEHGMELGTALLFSERKCNNLGTGMNK